MPTQKVDEIIVFCVLILKFLNTVGEHKVFEVNSGTHSHNPI